MVAVLRLSAPHRVVAILVATLTAAAAFGQAIDFSWTSEGRFNGTPSGGTVDTMFSSSTPFDLTEFHTRYTGVGGATRVFGPFEITAASGDKLFGDSEIIFRGPVGLGMNIGNGPFTFSGGTGQFSGATGQGNIDVITTLDRFPTTTGTVEQKWRGSITLVPLAGGKAQLQAGDAERDLDFDQLDLVRVQVAAKYLTGQPATWGEGDWNGAPGGDRDNPPPGNGQFDQLDIIAALAAGKYLTGPYAALAPGGMQSDGQASIVYDAATGAVSVDAPAGVQLTSINIDSAAGIFTGARAQNLGGSFDNDSDGNIFKATFGSSFGSLSFGNVAQAALSASFLLGDLTVVGSLAGGGDLGNVDLVYVPEPSAIVLVLLGLTSLAVWQRKPS